MATGGDGGVILPSLLVVLVLAGGATLMSVAAGLAVLAHRRTGELPYALERLPVAVLAAVLGITGVGVVTYVDGPAHVSWLLAVTVVAPLATGMVRARRRTDLDRLDAAGATAMAWGPPFLLGLFVTFGVTVLVIALLEPATGEAGSPPVLWIAAAVGGVVTVVGTLEMLHRLSRLMSSAAR